MPSPITLTIHIYTTHYNALQLVEEIRIMAEEINESANVAISAQLEVQKILEETKALVSSLQQPQRTQQSLQLPSARDSSLTKSEMLRMRRRRKSVNCEDIFLQYPYCLDCLLQCVDTGTYTNLTAVPHCIGPSITGYQYACTDLEITETSANKTATAATITTITFGVLLLLTDVMVIPTALSINNVVNHLLQQIAVSSLVLFYCQRRGSGESCVSRDDEK